MLKQHINCKNAFTGPDNIVCYSDILNEYGLIIHDGGESYVRINYCPWCGAKLPDSERDNWFNRLEAQGYDNPMEQEIPEEYKSDAWWNSVDK